MAIIPETIKIGCITYTVALIKKKQLGDYWGRLDKIKQVVEILHSLAPQRKAETLFHEVLHGAYELAGLNHIEEPSEEQVVNGLSYQLVQILRDNPNLVAYVLEPEE